MFSTGKTGWKCPTVVREPGYPAAGSSPRRNPKAPKITPQKRAPEGALKWFCGACFGKPGKRLDEAGKSQLTPGMGSGHSRTCSHLVATPLLSQPGQKLRLLLPRWAQEEPAPGRGNLIIRSRLNPGKNKEGVGRAAAHVARTHLLRYFSLCCFSKGCSNGRWPLWWCWWPPSLGALFVSIPVLWCCWSWYPIFLTLHPSLAAQPRGGMLPQSMGF